MVALLKSARSGDAGLVTMLLNKGVAINTVDKVSHIVLSWHKGTKERNERQQCIYNHRDTDNDAMKYDLPSSSSPRYDHQ